jgi:Transposase DDE domain
MPYSSAKCCAAQATKTTRLKEKIAKLKEEMQRLIALKVRMLAAPDQQISLTDPDAHSMTTSGRGSGVVGYNVKVAVDTKHHLIIMHEVTNVGTDRSQLAHVAKETKATLETESMDVVADRGYFNSEEILACEEARITVTLPKAAKADDLELTSARAAARAPRVATPPRRQAA